MTEWIDFSVYAAMIAAYWFVFAGCASPLALQMAADRNEEWMSANIERLTTLLRGRWLVGSTWFLRSCYAWGAISLVVLLAMQVGAWPEFLSTATVGSERWEVLKDAHSALFIVGLLYYFGVVIVSTRRIYKDVPLAERRQASLTPRSLDNFVPRWLSVATYVLIGGHLAAWIFVGTMGLYSAPGFWVRFVGPVVFSGIFLVVAHANVNRRMSDFFGFPDRRLAVRFTFGALIYAQFMFALRLFGEVVGPSFEVNRAMHLALVLGTVLAMAALVSTSKTGPNGTKSFLSPRRV